jgi:hypothetical protein
MSGIHPVLDVLLSSSSASPLAFVGKGDTVGGRQHAYVYTVVAVDFGVDGSDGSR